MRLEENPLGDPAIREAWRAKVRHEDQNRHLLYHRDGGADPGPHIWCDDCVADQGGCPDCGDFTRQIICESEWSWIVTCSCGQWSQNYDSPEACQALWEKHVEEAHNDGEV